MSFGDHNHAFVTNLAQRNQNTYNLLDRAPHQVPTNDGNNNRGRQNTSPPENRQNQRNNQPPNDQPENVNNTKRRTTINKMQHVTQTFKHHHLEYHSIR